MPQPKGQELRIDTLRRMVRECNQSECLDWPFARYSTGYGAVWNGTENVKAHRISYEMVRGPIPNGLIIRHRCDNRSCINPRHLEVGTTADNMRDKVERGRSSRGETHGRAKLTERDVSLIRGSTESSLVLGTRFGVSATMINNIRRGRNWTHVGAPC